MSYIVDNAIIMAAGTSSRFAPLSYEKPKALIEVKGDILIERQIKQLQNSGIPQIIVVVGYKKEQFYYLTEKCGIQLVENEEYLTRNNNASIYAVRNYLKNTYICSADNYFVKNPFEREVKDCYYAAVYADGPTHEWCMQADEHGYINDIQIGGSNAWYMLGHAFWNQEFSTKFVQILEKEYNLPETRDLLWESIYSKHIKELKMKMRKYSAKDIFEFDTLGELRAFDSSYLDETHSEILRNLAIRLNGKESEINGVEALKGNANESVGFTFAFRGNKYEFMYNKGKLRKL